MKILIKQPQNRHRWQSKALGSAQYLEWLKHDGSLTYKLQQHFLQIRVMAVKNAYEKPWIDETQALQIHANSRVLVREVFLLNKATPLVFAHSVIPHKSMRDAWMGLSRLGNVPLAKVLFDNPKVIRTPLSYRALTAQHHLYQRAQAQLCAHGFKQAAASLPSILWARRSIFHLNCANMMVTEVFLPALILV